FVSGTEVTDTGVLTVFSAGQLLGGQVDNAGEIDVIARGQAFNTIVAGGGFLNAGPAGGGPVGGIVASVTVNSGGQVQVSSGAVVFSTIVTDGGSLVSGGSAGSGNIISGTTPGAGGSETVLAGAT